MFSNDPTCGMYTGLNVFTSYSHSHWHHRVSGLSTIPRNALFCVGTLFPAFLSSPFHMYELIRPGLHTGGFDCWKIVNEMDSCFLNLTSLLQSHAHRLVVTLLLPCFLNSPLTVKELNRNLMQNKT